jgi:CRISPR-associated protein Cmr5
MAAEGQETNVNGPKDDRTLEQKRADHALRIVRRLRELDQSEEKERKMLPLYGNFRSYVENLPAMIVMNGLGQAMATELASARIGEGSSSGSGCDLSELIDSMKKSAKDDRNEDKKAHELLFCIIQNWLGKGEFYDCSGDHSLIDAIVDGSQDKYVIAQHETLAYLEWLKKFSQAFLRKGGKDER